MRVTILMNLKMGLWVSLARPHSGIDDKRLRIMSYQES
jgi:hypothetical protein